MTIREINIYLHRYLGLITVVFLIITSVTGALLAFKPSLDDWFNQKLAYVEPSHQPLLPIAVLHDKVVATYPTVGFSSMPVTSKPNRSVVFSADRQREPSPATQPTFNNVYINPYTGEVLGTRNFDDWAWHNTMSKVFWFHRNLLWGDTGKLILGIVSLLWTINCFVGLYLTFPRKKTAKKPAHTSPNANKLADWLQRWQRAWKIRKFSSWFKLNFDMHHAFGLWFWVMSLIIAWSSVAFNLKEVYQPVMQAMVGLTPASPTKPPATLPSQAMGKVADMPSQPLQIDKYHAIDSVTQLAKAHSQTAGKTFEQPLGLRWIDKEQAWQLRFTTREDFGTGRGASSITVNALTGKVEKVNFGSEAKFANKVEQVILSLHVAHIDAFLYRIFLSGFGIIVLILSMTGVYLWWRGRQARQKMREKTLLKMLPS